MGVQKFIRREKKGKNKRKLPKTELPRKLMEKLPEGYKVNTKRHVNLVKKTALAIAVQLKKKGVKVDQPLLRKLTMIHDVFRHLDRHERIAQNYFARKGFGTIARGIGRHIAAKPDRIKYFSIEEKIFIYSDEVSRWFKEKDLHKVVPLEEAIQNLKERNKGNPKLVKFIEEEGKAMKSIEKELVGKGMKLAVVHKIGEKNG